MPVPHPSWPTPPSTRGIPSSTSKRDQKKRVFPLFNLEEREGDFSQGKGKM